MNGYGPMCTTKKINLTTSFVKISSQVSRRYLHFGNCEQIISYAFVPTGQAVPVGWHSLAAYAEFREQMCPGGDLYMKAAAAATCIITE